MQEYLHNSITTFNKLNRGVTISSNEEVTEINLLYCNRKEKNNYFISSFIYKIISHRSLSSESNLTV